MKNVLKGEIYKSRQIDRIMKPSKEHRAFKRYCRECDDALLHAKKYPKNFDALYEAGRVVARENYLEVING